LKTEKGAVVFEIVKSAVSFVTLTASHDPDVTPFPRIVTRCHAQCVTRSPVKKQKLDIPRRADVLILPYKPGWSACILLSPYFPKA